MGEDEEMSMALKAKGEELFSAVCHSMMTVDNIDGECDPCPVSGDAMRIMGAK